MPPPVMPTAIVTGTTGPDMDLTTTPLSDVRRMVFEFDRNILKIDHGTPTKTLDLTFDTLTAITFTVAANRITAVTIA